MALTQATRNYELLVRFHPNGKLGGSLQEIKEFLEDGVPVGTAQVGELRELGFTQLQSIMQSITAEQWMEPETIEG